MQNIKITEKISPRTNKEKPSEKDRLKKEPKNYSNKTEIGS